MDKKYLRIKYLLYNIHLIKWMDYYCKQCKKQYSSYKSLWNHNTKYHTPQKTSNYYFTPQKSSKSELSKPIENITSNNLNCKYCNKLCSRLDNLKRHENTCKNKNDIINENEILKKENEMFKKEFDNMKSQLLQLINQNKIHPKTLQKINNNISNSNNNNSNNKIINNTYVKFDRVDISKLLSKKEIIGILNKKLLSIEEAIKTVHFNEKLPEYSNIYITNMRDNNAYVFDGTSFITVSKDEVINELINNYSEEIELSFDTYKNKLSEHTIKRLEVFLEQLNSDDKFVDANKKSYSNYKLFKIANIKRMIYDNSDAKKFLSLNKMELVEKLIKNTEESDDDINNIIV
jgi:hypothetical protein